MIEDDLDTPEEGEEDENPQCPHCRAELDVQMLECKTDPELSLTWARYCHRCTECGYRSGSWETLD